MYRGAAIFNMDRRANRSRTYQVERRDRDQDRVPFLNVCPTSKHCIYTEHRIARVDHSKIIHDGYYPTHRKLKQHIKEGHSRDGDALRGLRLHLARVRHGEHPVFHRSLDLLGLGNEKSATTCACDSGYRAYLDALGDGERAREAAEAALAHDVAMLVAVRLELGLAGDGEEVVVHVDGHVLLVDAGQLEGRGDEVLVLVLVDVNPVPS